MAQSSTYQGPGDEDPLELSSSIRKDDSEPSLSFKDERTLHDEDLSTVSTRSTIVYEQEPFESFRKKVQEFAESKWPEYPPGHITIERMKGGGFNRIICITLHHPLTVADGSRMDKYILRLPRFDAARLDRDVAALLFVRKDGFIPVPEVVTFDETDRNILQSPYMLQKKLPGRDLYSHFHLLDHQFKRRLAHDLGRIFKHMRSLRNTKAGKLVLLPNEKSPEPDVGVEPFSTESSVPRVISDHAPENDTAEAILFSFDMADYADDIRKDLTRRFKEMTHELCDAGLLEKNWICLCHLDLAPRNILINIEPDLEPNACSIAGILDWDSAIFAPSFLSCAPPLWLWAWNDDEDEDERTANDTPPTEEGRELKRIFEKAAGKYYVRFAYPAAYRLARRLVLFAVKGIGSVEGINEARAMLEEWKRLRYRLLQDHTGIFQ